MPRRKKPAHELTTQEVLKKMFPKPVREKIAHETKNISKDGTNRSTPRHSS